MRLLTPRSREVLHEGEAFDGFALSCLDVRIPGESPVKSDGKVGIEMLV